MPAACLPHRNSARLASQVGIATQVNSFCSTLAGQLVRGDAVLSAKHASQASLEAWIKQITTRHSLLNNVAASAGLSPSRSPPLAYAEQTHEEAQKRPLPPAKQGSHRSDRAQGSLEKAAPISVLQQSDSQDLRAAKKGNRDHVATAVPDDTCEPRFKLLWRLVGQASSVSWEYQASTAKIANSTINPAKATAVDAPAALDDTQNSAVRQAEVNNGGPPLDAEGRSQWGDLQQELIAKIAASVKAAAGVEAMVHTCR